MWNIPHPTTLFLPRYVHSTTVHTRPFGSVFCIRGLLSCQSALPRVARRKKLFLAFFSGQTCIPLLLLMLHTHSQTFLASEHTLFLLNLFSSPPPECSITYWSVNCGQTLAETTKVEKWRESLFFFPWNHKKNTLSSSSWLFPSLVRHHLFLVLSFSPSATCADLQKLIKKRLLSSSPSLSLFALALITGREELLAGRKEEGRGRRPTREGRGRGQRMRNFCPPPPLVLFHRKGGKRREGREDESEKERRGKVLIRIILSLGGENFSIDASVASSSSSSALLFLSSFLISLFHPWSLGEKGSFFLTTFLLERETDLFFLSSPSPLSRLWHPLYAKYGEILSQ